MVCWGSSSQSRPTIPIWLERTVSDTQSKGNTAEKVAEICKDVLERLEPVRRLPGRNTTKADILVYRHGGLEIALKDYAGRPRLIRHTLGRWLIRREAAAYRAAHGIRGLPQFLGRLGPLALATRWVDASPLATVDRQRLTPDRMERLADLVGRLHERGVAIADLHHRDVLLGDDDEIYIVEVSYERELNLIYEKKPMIYEKTLTLR